VCAPQNTRIICHCALQIATLAIGEERHGRPVWHDGFSDVWNTLCQKFTYTFREHQSLKKRIGRETVGTMHPGTSNLTTCE
jgi:hypothetical protein